MAKRLLCVVLSIMLVVAMMPMGVVADEEVTYTDWTSSTSLPTSGTYKLTTDVTISKATTLTADLTLDLAGYTVSSASAQVLLVNSGITLTINDSCGSGKISFSGGTSKYLVSVKSGGTLIINGGTLVCYGGYTILNKGTTIINGGTVQGDGNTYTIYNGGSQSSSSLTINDGTVIHTGTSSTSYPTIYNADGYNSKSTPTVTINGGTVTNEVAGGYAISNSSGTVTIKGGTVSNTSSSGTAIVTSIATDTVGSTYDSGSVTITGGEVYSTGTMITDSANAVSISGGTFKTSSDGTVVNVTAYLADGYTQNNTGAVVANVTTYTLTYNSNGGDGTVTEATAYEEDTEVTVASGDGLTRDGYTFNGWNTASDGTGTAYSAGSTIEMTADVTLYAQWTAISYVTGFNVNLGSYLAMGFYLPVTNLDVSDGSTTYTVVITQTYSDDYSESDITEGDTRSVSYVIDSTTSSTLETRSYGSQSCYFLSIDGINAKELADGITVTVKKGDTVIYTSSTTSIAKYEQLFITYYSSDTNGVTLAKALLNYGAAAQVYFGYNTEDLASSYIPS